MAASPVLEMPKPVTPKLVTPKPVTPKPVPATKPTNVVVVAPKPVAPKPVAPHIVQATPIVATVPTVRPAVATAPVVTQAAEALADSDQDVADDRRWDDFLEASIGSGLVILVAKIVSAIGLAWLLDVPMSRQWAWGFFPYAGLATTAEQFRRIATLSSVAVTVVAVLWLLAHLVRQRRHSLHHLWGVFLALPMVAFMVVLEWSRNVNVQHLVDTAWLVRIGLALVATAIVFYGFIHRADEEEAELAPAANPRRHRTIVLPRRSRA